MINHKIVEYIQQNLDSGYDTAVIRKRLIDHGYLQNDIDDTINHVQQQSKANQTINDGSSKFARFRAKFSPAFVVAILILAAVTTGLSFLVISNNSNNLAAFKNNDEQMLTGKSATDIYEENTGEQQAGQQEAQINKTEAEEQPQISINETEIKSEELEVITPKIKGFEFPSTSIVITQHNLSMSLDDIKHEIKSEYWGKITRIMLTVLNNGSAAFKPKVLVLLYDEKDFKEEWLKPKAEIEFDIEKLYPNEHTTREAIVSISFDDIALTKHFKLILVDAADPANKPIVVVEKEFNPLTG